MHGQSRPPTRAGQTSSSPTLPSVPSAISGPSPAFRASDGADPAGASTPPSLPPGARTEGISLAALEEARAARRSGADDVDVADAAGGEVPDRFPPGTRLLKSYVVERQLGQGGMGAVYLAVDEVSGQRVAVKVLPASLAREKDIRERFVREARALAALDHPGIVPLVTFAQDGDDRYLVMKMVSGEPLDARLRRVGTVEPEEAGQLLRAICDALAYAHARGVVHRDIKPSNILVRADDDPAAAVSRIVLVDFGIARRDDGEADARGPGGLARLTQTGMLMGTPQYMSPEQISGLPVDGRADLYAAGLILFELLVGEPPFDGERTFDILRAHVDTPVPDVALVRAQHHPTSPPVPPLLSGLCHALLQKRPADRPASGEDVVAILDGRMALPAGSVPAGFGSLPPTESAAVDELPRRPPGPGARPTTETPALPPSTDAFFQTSRSPMRLERFSDQPPTTFEGLTPPENPARTWAMVLFAGLVVVGVGAVLFGDRLADLMPVIDEAEETAAVGIDTEARDFQLAVLQARAQVAFEAQRLDDARVAVDTALHLAGVDAPPSLRLLRAEILLAGNNPTAARETLKALDAAARARLSGDDAARLVELEAAIAAPPPSGSTASTPRRTTRRRQAPPPPSRRSAKDLQAATHKGHRALARCYEQGVLQKDATASGTVVLSLIIAPAGEVTSVAITRRTVGDADFAACVRAVAEKWVFPPFSGGDDTLEHTLTFSPAEG